MKHFKQLAMACLCAVATSASAQFVTSGKSVTPREVNTSSYNRISLSYNPLNISTDVKGEKDQNLHGFSFDYTHGFSVSKKLPLFVELGARLNYSFKTEEISEFYGENSEGENLGDAKSKHMHIAVPVNFTYKWQLPNGKVAVSPYIGLTFKYNVMAKTKFDYNSGDDEYDDKDWYTSYGYDYDDDWGYGDYEGDNNNEIDYFDKKDVGKDGQWSRFQVGWQIGLGIDYKSLHVGVRYGSDFGEICKKTSTSSWGISVGYNF